MIKKTKMHQDMLSELQGLSEINHFVGKKILLDTKRENQVCDCDSCIERGTEELSLRLEETV